MSEVSTRPATILVIDDSEIALEWIAAMLEDDGWSVETRTSPFLSASELAAIAADVVLLDLGLPGVTDDDLPAIVAALRLEGASAVVLHSGRGEGELADVAARIGADGHLCKTGDEDSFLAAMARYRPA